MFTGIIEEIGKIVSLTTDKENLNIYFHNIFNVEFNQEDYFYLDKHPNNLGHKKIGENLYNILKTNLLIN